MWENIIVQSRRSDSLLDYDPYIKKFCKIQYEALYFVIGENRNNQIDEYR